MIELGWKDVNYIAQRDISRVHSGMSLHSCAAREGKRREIKRVCLMIPAIVHDPGAVFVGEIRCRS